MSAETVARIAAELDAQCAEVARARQLKAARHEALVATIERLTVAVEKQNALLEQVARNTCRCAELLVATVSGAECADSDLG